MSRLRRRVLAAGILGFVAFAGAPVLAGEGLHACPDASGNIVYQDDPCAEVPAKAVKKAATVERVVPARSTPAVRPPAPRPPVKRAGTAPVVPAFRPTGPIPPEFASPERTWTTFTTAMRSGDRAAARACLTSSALADFGERVTTLPVEALKDTVDAVTRLEVEGTAGPFWSVRAVHASGRPTWIFFEQLATGAWKIAAI